MTDEPNPNRRPLLPLDFDLGAEGATSHPYYLLDCFSDRALAGNQLAVFVAGEGLSGELMQSLAREMNLSESVFLLPARKGGDLRARIFTPARELPFAGHPVLGTGILAGLALGLESVGLETGAGLVRIDLETNESRTAGSATFARMAQPIPTWEEFARPDELLAALGVESSGLPVEAYRNGPVHVFVALDDEAAVAAVAPDLGALERLGAMGVSCFAVLGGAGEAPRVKTRMFAPGLGVAEDPATGSAAGPLAVHLARHGQIAFGEQIEISQGEEIGRPSRLFARVEGARVEGAPERIDRVEVGGSAVVVGQGEILLPRGGPPDG